MANHYILFLTKFYEMVQVLNKSIEIYLAVSTCNYLRLKNLFSNPKINSVIKFSHHFYKVSFKSSEDKEKNYLNPDSRLKNKWLENIKYKYTLNKIGHLRRKLSIHFTFTLFSLHLWN